MVDVLAGIRVADFSRVLAGPLATMMLADLGAEVIKVERRGIGDDTRHWGPPWTESASSYFECANRSKQSIALDFDDPADLRIAHDLACEADVVVENFRVGALAKKGLGYDAIASKNPRTIYCSITGFGSQEGADLPGYDFLVQALGGLMSITGEADSEPVKVGVALVDVLTSKDAVIGILAALRERSTSNMGQHVEVNLLSSLLGSMANQAAAHLATGTSPTRMGNQHPSIAPYETLRCRDGMIAVCCGNDRQFASLVETIGAPFLADDPRFRCNADRVEHRTELVAELETRLANANSAHWTHELHRNGVPAGTVGDVGSGLALATRLGLEPIVNVGRGNNEQIRNPITFSRTPVSRYGRPPELGEHNQTVRDRLANARKDI